MQLARWYAMSVRATDFSLSWLQSAKSSNQQPFCAGEKTKANFEQEVHVCRDLMRVQIKCRSQDYVRLIGKIDSLHPAAFISPSVHRCQPMYVDGWELDSDWVLRDTSQEADPPLAQVFLLIFFLLFFTDVSWPTLPSLWRLMLHKILHLFFFYIVW